MRLARVVLLLELVLIGLVLVPSGCMGPTFIVQQYPGPARPAETIAVLRIQGGGQVRVLSLDGEPTNIQLDPDARLHIEILPGLHRVLVQDVSLPVRPAQSAEFQANPGRSYGVRLVSGVPRVHELDPRSGASIRDVTFERPLVSSPAPVPPPSQAPLPSLVSPANVDGGAGPAPDAGADDGASPPLRSAEGGVSGSGWW